MAPLLAKSWIYLSFKAERIEKDQENIKEVIWIINY